MQLAIIVRDTLEFCKYILLAHTPESELNRNLEGCCCIRSYELSLLFIWFRDGAAGDVSQDDEVRGALVALTVHFFWPEN